MQVIASGIMLIILLLKRNILFCVQFKYVKLICYLIYFYRCHSNVKILQLRANLSNIDTKETETVSMSENCLISDGRRYVSLLKL